jgi:hypothetical protein
MKERFLLHRIYMDSNRATVHKAYEFTINVEPDTAPSTLTRSKDAQMGA